MPRSTDLRSAALANSAITSRATSRRSVTSPGRTGRIGSERASASNWPTRRVARARRAATGTAWQGAPLPCSRARALALQLDRRHRRAQLVRRVGDEFPLPLQRAAQPRKQIVQCGNKRRISLGRPSSCKGSRLSAERRRTAEATALRDAFPARLRSKRVGAGAAPPRISGISVRSASPSASASRARSAAPPARYCRRRWRCTRASRRRMYSPSKIPECCPAGVPVRSRQVQPRAREIPDLHHHQVVLRAPPNRRCREVVADARKRLCGQLQLVVEDSARLVARRR